MNAQFFVEATFRLSSRKVFVAHGRILQGTVRPGQRVMQPEGLDAPVSDIGFLLISIKEGRENPTLSFQYETEDQAARWEALSLAGKTLELEDSPSRVGSVAS